MTNEESVVYDTELRLLVLALELAKLESLDLGLAVDARSDGVTDLMGSVVEVVDGAAFWNSRDPLGVVSMSGIDRGTGAGGGEEVSTDSGGGFGDGTVGVSDPDDDAEGGDSGRDRRCKADGVGDGGIKLGSMKSIWRDSASQGPSIRVPSILPEVVTYL